MATLPPVAPRLKPKAGNLTFEAEGTEGGLFHSRKLHVPPGASGLTLGRGYDMKSKSEAKIIADLVRSGVDSATASKISKASGLTGEKARQFIKDQQLADFEISPTGQVTLFESSYELERNEVVRISSKADTVAAYGALDWKHTDPAIQDLLVDLKFRGDYTPATRKIVQPLAVKNDVSGLAAAMSNKSIWINVPPDRLRRRADYMQKAVDALQQQPNKPLVIPRGAPTSLKNAPQPIGHR